MFKFAENYPPGPNKFLCDGWCCNYAPIPRDPKETPPVLSAEEQAHIETLKNDKIFSKCYFETLDDIYNALDFELLHCIRNYKVRELSGQFSFKGKQYAFARVFDFEHDQAWIKITDMDGNILYERDNSTPH